MNTSPLRIVALLGIALSSAPASLFAQVSLTGSYSQSFIIPAGDSDPGVNTWTDNSTLAGWYASVNGSTASQYRATNGNGNSGDPGLYLFRTGTSNAALGTRRSTSNTGFTAFGVQFVNSTGGTITTLDVSYYLQQWQLSTGTGDGLDFQYSLDATSLTTGTWTDHDALDGNAITVATTAPSGNTYVGYANGSTIDNSIILSSDYSATITSSISGLSLAAGESIWFRWVDRDIGGTDHALSIDNFTVTSVPEPSTYAALAGLAMLGFAALRRRSRKV